MRCTKTETRKARFTLVPETTDDVEFLKLVTECSDSDILEPLRIVCIGHDYDGKRVDRADVQFERVPVALPT